MSCAPSERAKAPSSTSPQQGKEIVCIRTTPEKPHYHWLAEDPEYRRVFEETEEMAYGQIHDEAVSRAVEGWLEPVFYQGRQCGVVRRYSDSLLMLLLKLKMPEKYGNP